MTPAELREQSRLCRQAAPDETTLEIKRRLASSAFALAQLVEKIEREQAAREPAPVGQPSEAHAGDLGTGENMAAPGAELRVMADSLYIPCASDGMRRATQTHE